MFEVEERRLVASALPSVDDPDYVQVSQLLELERLLTTVYPRYQLSERIHRWRR